MRKYIVFFSVVLVIFINFQNIYAEEKETGDLNKILENARKSFVNADFENACRGYREVYDKENNNTKAICGLIDSLIYANKWWDAYSVAEAEEKMKPSDPLIICAIAKANYKVGQIRHAFELYRYALNLNSDLSEACIGLAEILSLRNDIENVNILMKKAVKIAGEYPYYWAKCGYINQNNKDISMPYFKKFLSCNAKFEKKQNDHVRTYLEVMNTMKDAEIFKVKGPEEFSIPFELVMGIPVVNVSINNRPAKFFFDTGCNLVLLDDKFADEIGIKSIAEGITGTTSRNIVIELFRIDSLSIGKCKIYNCIGANTSKFDMIEQIIKQNSIDDNIKLEAMKAKDIKGIIPVQKMFYDYKVKFDYKNNVIVFFQEDTLIKDKRYIDMFLESGLPYVMVSVDDNKYKPFLIDTGANSTSLDNEYVVVNKLKIFEADIPGSIGLGGFSKEKKFQGCRKIELGAYTINLDDKRDISVGEQEQTNEPHSYISFGGIGNDFLRVINPVFDFKNARLYIN